MTPSTGRVLEIDFATSRDGVELRWRDARSSSVATVSLGEIGIYSSRPTSSKSERREPVSPPDAPPFALTHIGAAPGPVWLSFAAPDSLLPLLPWERWLRPTLGTHPIRLGLDGPRVSAPTGPRRIAILASLPDDEKRFPIAEIIGRIAHTAPIGSEVHIFTEAAYLGEVRSRLPGFPLVHDPPRVPADTSVDTRDDETMRSPWLRWLTGATTSGLDELHLVAHGVYQASGSVLAVAADPHNPSLAASRYLGARQVAAAVDRTGARTLSLTIVPRCYSRSGVQAFASRVSRLRAGAVVVLDTERDAAVAVPALASVRHALEARALNTLALSPHAELYTSPSAFMTERTGTLSDYAAERLSKTVDATNYRAREFIMQSAILQDARGADDTDHDRERHHGSQQALDFLATLLEKKGASR